MNRMLPYLLRSKRGILGTVLFSAAAMIISGIVLSFPMIIRFFRVIINPELIWHEDFYDHYPDIDSIYDFLMKYGLRNAESCSLELISLIAGGLVFVFLCGNAFRFGMANGASRSTIIKTTAASVFITAGAMTALNMILETILVRLTPFFFDEPMYIKLLSYYSIDLYSDNYTEITSFEMIMRNALMYFVLALIILSLITLIYGLYRRFWVYGTLGGMVAAISVYPTFTLIRDSNGQLTSAVRTLFISDEPFFCLYNGGYHNLLGLKASGVLTAASVLIAAALVIYGLCVKRSGLAPTGSR